MTDPDGDSLVFSLTYCRGGNYTSSVNYAGGYSGTNPLPTSGGVTVDPRTGTVCFTPSALAIGVVCIRVEEYRNGVKIGEYERDMQLRVVSCSNQLPRASGINGVPYNPNDPTTYTIEICATGAPTCFNINFSDPDGQPLTVSWNNGIPAGSFVVNNNNTPNPTATFCWTPTPADIGQHQFVVTVMDNACPIRGVSNFGYVVNVIGGVVHPVDAGPDATICQGQSVTLNGSVGGPPGDIASVQWFPATGLNNPNILNPVASPTSTTTYTLQVTFVGGCRRTDQVTVTVLPLPAPPTVTPLNPQICSGSSVMLTASSPGAVDYEWRQGSATGPIVGTGSGITVWPTTTTTYYVVAVGANGCRSTPTAVTVVVHVVSLRVSGVVNVSCNGGSDGSVSVSMSASGGTPGYQYSLNGGPWVGGPGGTYTFTGLSAGTYTITVWDANGCQVSTTVTVSEPPVLTFSVTTSNALCAGTATGTIIFSASGGIPRYEYSTNGGVSCGGPSTWNVGAGTYVLYVRDANGCVAGPQTVTISEPAPLAFQSVVTDATCRESSDGGALVVVSGGTPPYTYTWSGAGLSGPVSGPSVGNVAPGSYTVVVADANGCRDSLVVNVGYRSYVDVEIRPDSIAGCVPLGVRWEGVVNGVGPFVSYDWDLGDGNSANTPLVDWVYTEGRYVVRLIVRNADGCSDTAYTVAEAYFTPVPQYSAEPDIREELVIGTVINLTSTTQGATSTQWFIPGYGSHSGPVWQLRFVEAGEYCFTLLVQRNGCADSVRGCIRVKDPYVYLPNAFTPNGDGVNDVFEVKVWGLKDARMRIWDRWGILVFDNGGDMTKFWDGTYQGRPSPEDAYTYVIEGKVPPHDRPYRRTGTVTLIR